MFYDEARIYIKAGDGGDGCVAFRREKHVPFGGPSGGDGGRGGDVILVVDEHLNTLHRFSRQRRFLAGRGEHGRGKNQHGKGGEPLRIPVPPGTLVYNDESGDLLGDLVELDDELVVGQGGRGGRGNARFTTSTNQAPRIAEHGEGGTERWLRLELKLLADVGLVGVPNAGKSTLLAAVTAARPKIASYPFTTLEPNLGVVVLDDDTEFVLADIPGLIEGASEGKGLGHEFLRHVERTRLLVHLLDGMAPDPLSDFATINQELAAFGHGLAEKPQIVVLNKMDVPSVRDRWPEIERKLVAQGHRSTSVSALSRERTTELLWRIARELSALPPAELKREVPVFRLDADAHTFSIGREEDGWRVRGVDIERMASMTVWNLDEAVQRFIYTLERTGIADALREVGAQPGDTIYVGDKELEWEE